MKKILLIGLVGLLASCMQLDEIDVSANGNSSGSSGNSKLQMEKHRQDTGVSYYEAILICNAFSLLDALDSLYQYDEPISVEESFWLPNIKILENRSGYRLPTKEEWLRSMENGEMEDVDENIGEWLYSELNTQYSVYELAPKFSKAVGFRKNPNYGVRLLKVLK